MITSLLDLRNGRGRYTWTHELGKACGDDNDYHYHGPAQRPSHDDGDDYLSTLPSSSPLIQIRISESLFSGAI